MSVHMSLLFPIFFRNIVKNPVTPENLSPFRDDLIKCNMYNYGVDHSFIIFTCVLLGDFLKYDMPKHGLKMVKLIKLHLQREYFHRTIS